MLIDETKPFLLFLTNLYLANWIKDLKKNDMRKIFRYFSNNVRLENITQTSVQALNSKTK